jgi:hypothetical protein
MKCRDATVRSQGREEISLYHSHGTFVSRYRMVFLYA